MNPSGGTCGAARCQALWVTAGVAVITVILRGGASALLVLLDAIGAVAVLFPVVCAGWWMIPRRWIEELPRRWHFLYASAFGIGVTSIAVLLAGCVGCLHRTVWVGLLVLAAASGVLRLRRARTGRPQTEPCRASGHPTSPAWGWLWLLAAVPLGLSLTAASAAPGILWSEEGFGYDALEYHLEMPREYFDAGRIAYAPHNVYANFPANVEMLYLLAFILHDDPRDVGSIAQMIHLFLGMLAIYAIWTVASEWSAPAGHIAGVAAATTGWFAYLAGLAYVENGLLFFGAAALAAWLQAARRTTAAVVGRSRASDAPSSVSVRSDGTVGRIGSAARTVLPQGESAATKPNEPDLSLPNARTDGATEPYRSTADSTPGFWVSGLLAGLACGCKYTGAAMFALPLILAAWQIQGTTATRARAALAVLVGVAITFSPWLIKNTVMTGNPVFPLANSVFKAAPPGWGDEQTSQWHRGHATASENLTAMLTDPIAALADMTRALWHRVLADPEQRFGPAVLLLALGGSLLRDRSFEDRVLLLMLGNQVLIWVFATHWFARFAVVMLVPLGLLAGRCLEHSEFSCSGDAPPQSQLCKGGGPRPGRSANSRFAPGDGHSRRRVMGVAILLICGAVWNLVYAGSLHFRECPGPIPSSAFREGRIPGYEYYGYINRELPLDASLLLLGESRGFYFERRVDYAVVFNRQPFAEAVATARTDQDLVDWLRSRGYTHVLVNWAEVRRLSATYGFPPSITPALFDRLRTVGLSHMRSFRLPGRSDPFVDVYSVPPVAEASSSHGT